ncbi:hypothetical protein EJ08DRAFT_644364 [Tothia fuscella]|uniref:Mitochondrial outer membrane transport complex Sam37/metaxin N-terminal domain-containing protein n=1 Tax=Tothia fuscella TaxID=1048955 RepID=A0A9P4P3H8_9PEZI|nr:hypothetical protein EJ08DRAFT_644364 [Tothia fuscella]
MEGPIALRVWGKGLGLPSVDAECIAAITYLAHTSESNPDFTYTIISDYDTDSSPNGDFPVLSDTFKKTAGYGSIIKELENVGFGINNSLSAEQQSELPAWTSFIQQRGQELLDLYLYASYYNYWDQMSPAFTKILPWYYNYIIPPARRAAAIARTKYLGIRSLDIDNLDDVPTDKDGRISGKPSATTTSLSPAQSTPQQVLDQQRMQKWLRVQKHSDTFQLYQLSEAFFRPLNDLLGEKKYLLNEDEPTSLDCLAIGYLAPMLLAPVTQPWLADALKQRFPKLQKYTARFHGQTFGHQGIFSKDIMESAPSPSTYEGIKFMSQSISGWVVSWKNTVTPDPTINRTSPSHFYSTPFLSSAPIQAIALSATVIAGLAFAASKYILVQSGDDNVFTHDKRKGTVRLTDMGEAGAALAAFGQRREIDAGVERERQRTGRATVVEVDVEGENGDIGRQVLVS